MIQEERDGKIITYKCRTCDSINIVKNGTNRLGHQQYFCKDCKARRVLVSRREEKRKEKKKDRSKVLAACLERTSMRGIARIFKLSRNTLKDWVIEHFLDLPTLKETLLPAQSDDILEWDEAWSFVRVKVHKRWLWTVLCRRTRQIVGYQIGDRSEKTCRALWNSIPTMYKRAFHYSDLWKAYQKVLPEDQHLAVEKDSGETNHQERWYNTLRQWLGRYTRRTLSFSKVDFYHHLFTEWFIIEHNLRMKMMSLT